MKIGTTIKFTFDSSPDTLCVSLKILVDNFGYFEKKNILNTFHEKESCINISCVGKDDFETLLTIITKGYFKIVFYKLCYILLSCDI